MKYGNKSFSVIVGGQAYGEGWERTFRSGQAAASSLEPTPAPVSQVPMAPVTLRCASCGHATVVTRREDFELHRAHVCSGRKSVAVDAHSDAKEVISASWRAFFPSPLFQDLPFAGAAS